MSEIRTVVTITGKVQGVCYRLSAQEQARRLGVRGWIRNRVDGAVEGEFEGDEAAVEQFLAWCRQGPPGARVTGLEVRRGKATGRYRSFEIIG